MARQKVAKRKRPRRRNDRVEFDELDAAGHLASTANLCADRVLEALAEHGEGDPLDIEELAARAGCSPSAARRALKGMEEKGWATSRKEGDPRKKRGAFQRTIYSATRLGVEALEARKQALVQRDVDEWSEHLEQLGSDVSFDPSEWGGEEAEDEDGEPRLVESIEEHPLGDGVIIQLHDDRTTETVGQLWLAPMVDPRYPELEAAEVRGVRVLPTHRRQKIATQLHELAAKHAESWGLPLSSSDDRTWREARFWGKQKKKGRAQQVRGKAKGSGSRVVLSFPPPVSLNPAPTWRNFHDIPSEVTPEGYQQWLEDIGMTKPPAKWSQADEGRATQAMWGLMKHLERTDPLGLDAKWYAHAALHGDEDRQREHQAIGTVLQAIYLHVVGLAHIGQSADKNRRETYARMRWPFDKLASRLAWRRRYHVGRRANPGPDARLRSLERAALAGDEEALAAWVGALLRAGRLDELERQGDPFLGYVALWIEGDLRMGPNYTPAGVIGNRIASDLERAIRPIGRGLFGDAFVMERASEAPPGRTHAWWLSHRSASRSRGEWLQRMLELESALNDEGIETWWNDHGGWTRHPASDSDARGLGFYAVVNAEPIADVIAPRYVALLRRMGGGQACDRCGYGKAGPSGRCATCEGG